MATRTPSRTHRKARDSYFDLIQKLPLASIRTESQLEQAQVFMDALLTKGKLDKGEAMYLEALSDLVAVYEDQQHPIESASDADMLRHLMDAKGVSQVELHRDTGIAKSTISEVLSGKKPYSRQVMRTLAEYFHVDVSVLAANV